MEAVAVAIQELADLEKAKSNNRVQSLVDEIKQYKQDVYNNTKVGSKVLNVSDFGVPIDYMKLKEFVETINAIEKDSMKPEEKKTLKKEKNLIDITKKEVRTVRRDV